MDPGDPRPVPVPAVPTRKYLSSTPSLRRKNPHLPGQFPRGLLFTSPN